MRFLIGKLALQDQINAFENFSGTSLSKRCHPSSMMDTVSIGKRSPGAITPDTKTKFL
jgi:hypothetical protein